MPPSPMRRNPKRRFRPTRYKDIDTVMENQRDLVEVVHTLKQVVCVKG
jgi:RNA-splicing ligase RtcB